jgi:SAM-dependent methyltransferase
VFQTPLGNLIAVEHLHYPQLAEFEQKYDLFLPKVEAIGDNTRKEGVFKKLNSNEYQVFDGHQLNLDKLVESIKKKNEEKIAKQKDKPLAEQFHVTRQWKGYETALFNRLLLAFDFNGNSMSFRGDTSVNGLDTLERFINDTKAKLRENIKAFQLHEGTTELSQAIRDEKLKLLEGINGVAIGYKHWQGLRSADQWRKQGVFVKALGEKIYPFWSVFVPTRQDYIDLFAEVIKSTNLLKDLTTPILEIGCGTGVLSILMAKNLLGKNNQKIIATDVSPFAVENTRFNAEKILKERAKIIEAIRCDLFPAKKRQYDLIVCNPPFLVSKSVHSLLEQSTFDKDGNVLKRLFSETAQHLTDKGTFVLIYSDMAMNLNMQPMDAIEQLCARNNLEVKNKFVSAVSTTFPMESEDEVLTVIEKFKQNSRLFVYLIGKTSK